MQVQTPSKTVTQTVDPNHLCCSPGAHEGKGYESPGAGPSVLQRAGAQWGCHGPFLSTGENSSVPLRHGQLSCEVQGNGHQGPDGVSEGSRVPRGFERSVLVWVHVSQQTTVQWTVVCAWGHQRNGRPRGESRGAPGGLLVASQDRAAVPQTGGPGGTYKQPLTQSKPSWTYCWPRPAVLSSS